MNNLVSKQLQFAPFSSSPDAGFWHKLTQKKLDEYGLDDREIPIVGHYSNADAPGLPCCLTVEYSAFEMKTPKRCLRAYGTLDNKNTLDAFRSCDKKMILESAARGIWSDIASGVCLREPQRLICFHLLAFANLKKYHYHYWFAFPAISMPVSVIKEARKLSEVVDDKQRVSFLAQYDSVVVSCDEGFFTLSLRDSGNKPLVETLAQCHARLSAVTAGTNTFTTKEVVVFGFCDPCTLEQHPGWPLRNYLALIASHFVDKVGTTVQVLCFRDRWTDGQREVGHSIVLTLELSPLALDGDVPTCAGWEKNLQQKLLPRVLDLGAIMDPVKLAEEAVDLNLKLMRWRLLPDLDLEGVSSTQCLLLGAGTLGCNVARCLMGWGVRNITFVDSGRVSYSNPVRQSLFSFGDCMQGGKPKAQAAADALKLIFPGVNATAHALAIPMPGHVVSESTRAQIQKDTETLAKLIATNDAIFLLTDTRESRWLPSILAASAGKIVINAALGFDTWLVMRHGVKAIGRAEREATANGHRAVCSAVTGDQLGCYFCNDVVAPRDSTRDRTLDQQCTVSRPGLSMMAAGLAVELLVSVLQHPDRGLAPASVRDEDEANGRCLSLLGVVPHQLRGFLSRFQILSPLSKAFNRCTACSSTVIEQYQKDGFDFLMKVFNEPHYLEDLTGLTQLHAEAADVDIVELSDCSDD